MTNHQFRLENQEFTVARIYFEKGLTFVTPDGTEVTYDVRGGVHSDLMLFIELKTF